MKTSQPSPWTLSLLSRHTQTHALTNTHTDTHTDTHTGQQDDVHNASVDFSCSKTQDVPLYSNNQSVQPQNQEEDMQYAAVQFNRPSPAPRWACHVITSDITGVHTLILHLKHTFSTYCSCPHKVRTTVACSMHIIGTYDFIITFINVGGGGIPLTACSMQIKCTSWSNQCVGSTLVCEGAKKD